MKKHLIYWLILISNSAIPQSASVFDANYFNLGNTSPLIEVGKGINITDVYKPTKYCFMPLKTTKLKSSGAGTKTSINIYYTKNENQYSTLRNFGSSGSVGCLSLFSVGGSEFSSYFTKASQNVERIVFVAKVDFGLFSLSDNPVLRPEPKALLTKSKYAEFIDQYGTHYINAVRKESSIWITLTKKSTTNQRKTGSGESYKTEFSSPTQGSVNFEVTDNSEVDKSINSEEYTISIEIKGPPMDKTGLEGGIKEILSNKEQEDKTEAIRAILNSALSGLSNPEQAMTTQYYYSPFSLYGLNVIKWNDKKQSKLVSINKSVIKVYHSKSIVDNLTAPDGINYITKKYDRDIKDFSKKGYYQEEYIKSYQAILPTISQYKFDLDTTVNYLERIYTKCSSIYCDLDSVCGLTGPYEDRVALLTTKINNELSKMASIKTEAFKASMAENSIPECEKEGKGYLSVMNLSINPYDFYEGDTFIETIMGNTTSKYKISPGTHQFKATQVKGFLMYPTVNYRKVIVQKPCEEATIKIGFED